LENVIRGRILTFMQTRHGSVAPQVQTSVPSHPVANTQLLADEGSDDALWCIPDSYEAGAELSDFERRLMLRRLRELSVGG
jgi:hypothetical protein